MSFAFRNNRSNHIRRASDAQQLRRIQSMVPMCVFSFFPSPSSLLLLTFSSFEAFTERVTSFLLLLLLLLLRRVVVAVVVDWEVNQENGDPHCCESIAQDIDTGLESRASFCSFIAFENLSCTAVDIGRTDRAEWFSHSSTRSAYRKAFVLTRLSTLSLRLFSRLQLMLLPVSKRMIFKFQRFYPSIRTKRPTPFLPFQRSVRMSRWTIERNTEANGGSPFLSFARRRWLFSL